MEKLVAKQVDPKTPNLLKFLEKNKSKNRMELAKAYDISKK